MGVALAAFARSICAASWSVMVDSVVAMVISSSSSSVTALCWLRPGSASRCDNVVLHAPVTFRSVIRSWLRAANCWSSPPMLQYADHASPVTSLPTVEEVLDNHASELGHDDRVSEPRIPGCESMPREQVSQSLDWPSASTGLGRRE